MKKGKIFFHPIEDSGSLTISWSVEPKGDAIEAQKGSGVGFFSDKKDLLCVIFDEVKVSHDHQVLEFALYRIEITIKHGQVEYIYRNSAQGNSTLAKKKLKTKAGHLSLFHPVLS